MDTLALRSKISLFFSSFKRKNVIISLVSTVFVLSALITGVIYVRQRQGILPVGASGVELQLVTASTTVKKDDEFDVNVYIDTKGMSVTGTDINVKYDSNQLLAESITKGVYLPNVFVAGRITTGVASIVLGCDPANPKVSTGEILATVKFKALGQGTSTNISLDPTNDPKTLIAALGQTTNVAGTLTPLTIVIAPAVVAPVVTLSANPTTITSGGSSVITWSTTGTTPTCTKSNGWTGTAAASGTQTVTPTATKTYTLTCTNSAGSNAKSVTITTTPAPINGGWSVWNPASCPTACGLPASTRTRTCTNPTPSNGGADCHLLDGGLPTSNCSATGACGCTAPLTSAQTIQCSSRNSGWTGTINQSRAKSSYPGCSWGSWTDVSNTCSCATPLTGTQTLSCPTGQSGSITQTRTKAAYPGCEWESWTTTSNTCAIISTATPTPTATPTGSAKVGDVNGDGSVNALDLGEIIQNYRQHGDPGWIPADLNHDGAIDALDLGLVIQNYRK